MKAIVIGATGATGKVLTKQLLDNPKFSQVVIFVRKNIDFDKLETYQAKITGDVLFSCLGTTLKQAGSKDAQYLIDYTYQYNFAKIAKQNGIKHYVLISADMANANAKNFYPKIKGELNNAVMALNFEKFTIFKPPLLIRENTDRLGEKMAEKVLVSLNGIGLLKSHKPLPTPLLAQAMINAVLNNQTGILNKEKIWQLLEK